MYTKRDDRFWSDLETILNEYLIELIHFLGVYGLHIFFVNQMSLEMNQTCLNSRGFDFR